MAGADPAPAPTTVQGIVGALQRDPVVLSPTLGNGHTAEVDATLHAQLADVTVPVYVVLTTTPAGYDTSFGADPDQQLASVLHARLGRDGVYVVHTTQGSGAVAIYGTRFSGDDSALSLVKSAGEDQVQARLQQRYGDDARVSDAADASVALSVLAHPQLPDPGGYPATLPVITDAQVQALTGAAWVDPGYVSDDDLGTPASTGLLAVVGVGVALGVAVVLFRVLRAVAAHRERPVPEAIDPAPLRAAARAALGDLEAALEGRGAATLEPERLLTASRCRDEALALVDGDDPLDLVGARVLALTGAAAARGRAPYRPCYVNPTHGAATTEARVSRGVEVPVCRRCASDVDASRPPDALLDARGRAYYLGRTRWARSGYGAVADVLQVRA